MQNITIVVDEDLRVVVLVVVDGQFFILRLVFFFEINVDAVTIVTNVSTAAERRRIATVGRHCPSDYRFYQQC